MMITCLMGVRVACSSALALSVRGPKRLNCITARNARTRRAPFTTDAVAFLKVMILLLPFQMVSVFPKFGLNSAETALLKLLAHSLRMNLARHSVLLA